MRKLKPLKQNRIKKQSAKPFPNQKIHQKIWKILGGIGLISSLILTYYSFIPKIEIDLDNSIHKKEAFSIAIKLKNESFFNLKNLKLKATFDSVVDNSNNRASNIVFDTFRKNKLSGYGFTSHVIDNPLIQVFPFSEKPSLKRAFLKIEVSYKFIYFIKQKKIERFYAIQDDDENIRWYKK